MSEITLIGEIPFLDILVNVYHDSYSTTGSINSAWQMRNPETTYQGVIYVNYTIGERLYPEDVIIPEQTERDREMLPKFVVTEQSKITRKLMKEIREHLKIIYNNRNVKQINMNKIFNR